VTASPGRDGNELREGLGRSLEQWGEPGAAELSELLREMLGEGVTEPTLRLERLKNEVYRLGVDGEAGRTLVLKLLKPAVAQTDRLVAERWLPALGLGDRCPRLLGAAAEREGRCVWHVYEELGKRSLGLEPDPAYLGAAIDLVAELHGRAAVHPLLPEVRWRARDLGASFFTSNLQDAMAALEALATLHEGVPVEFPASRARLLRRLQAVLEDAPRRLGVMKEVGGPDTLLHGDLWPRNVFVTADGQGPRARLIDWDHVGAGPFSYDLSTFLYRSSPEERPWILQRYREASERWGRRLPGNEELNLLFHTAEFARCTHCILFDAMIVLDERAEWAVQELMDYERWLETLRPPLPDGSPA